MVTYTQYCLVFRDIFNTMNINFYTSYFQQ